jgi:hypothetical protein
MTAINVNGESEHSALSNPITIPGGGGGNVPDAPVITSTTINNDSTVTIIWIVPAQGSEVITGYKIFKVSDDSLVGSTTTETTATFNLASYTPYYIKATNSVGDSLASNASDNFIYAPFLGIPLVESNNITLYFAADTADKLFPTFHIRSNDNSLRYTAAADVGSYTFSNLSSGIYRFYVKAVYTNTTESAEVYTDEISITSVSGPLPATPKILPPVLGNLTITLNWTGAGVGITSYKVTRSDNTGFLYESTVGGSSGTYTINTDLTAGTPITFTVTSVNASGECLVPASIIVSPVSNPEPPAHFVAYVGTVPGTVFLYWIPPSPTSGGTPVTGYVLTYNGITINLGPGVLKFFDNVAPEQGITFSLVSTNKVGSSIPIEAEIFEGGDVTDP